MLNLILKILLPIVGKGMEILVTRLLKLVMDYLEEKNQDKIDIEMKKKMRNSDRVIVARDLDGSFE